MNLHESMLAQDEILTQYHKGLSSSDKVHYAIFDCSPDELLNISKSIDAEKLNKASAISVSSIGTIINDAYGKEHVCSDKKSFLKFEYS